MQAENKVVLAPYLFWINIHTRVMERDFGAQVQKKGNLDLWISHQLRKVFKNMCMRARKAII